MMLRNDPEIVTSAKKTLKLGQWILVGLFFCYLGSGLYSIQSNELGVLLRFGKIIDNAIPSGIHYAIPWPIDRVYRVPVRIVHRLSVDDFFENGTTAKTFNQLTGLSTLLLTGDNNIVTLNCVLQYTIQNPAEYLFSMIDNEQTLRSCACNTLIHILAGMNIDYILTTGKDTIQIQIKQNLQQALDDIKSGLAVTFIELQDVHPPSFVQPNFDDVINARIDKEKTINSALSYRNEKIPKAKADAHRMVLEAEAYRHKAQTSAQGETNRFLSQLGEYQLSPQETRIRLYNEVLQDILPNLKDVYLIHSKEKAPLVRILLESKRDPLPQSSSTIESSKSNPLMLLD